MFALPFSCTQRDTSSKAQHATSGRQLESDSMDADIMDNETPIDHSLTYVYTKNRKCAHKLQQPQ